MLVGANGPLVTSFLATKDLKPKELIGTHGAIMVAQHLFKIIAFILLFNFLIIQYLFLVICTTITGFLGAWLAKVYLEKIAKNPLTPYSIFGTNFWARFLTRFLTRFLARVLTRVLGTENTVYSITGTENTV